MFAYYAKWIQDFSDKIQPMVNTKKFPLDERALNAFNQLKQDFDEASLWMKTCPMKLNVMNLTSLFVQYSTRVADLLSLCPEHYKGVSCITTLTTTQPSVTLILLLTNTLWHSC